MSQAPIDPHAHTLITHTHRVLLVRSVTQDHKVPKESRETGECREQLDHQEMMESQ